MKLMMHGDSNIPKIGTVTKGEVPDPKNGEVSKVPWAHTARTSSKSTAKYFMVIDNK
jgi:hypothetical protein